MRWRAGTRAIHAGGSLFQDVLPPDGATAGGLTPTPRRASCTGRSVHRERRDNDSDAVKSGSYLLVSGFYSGSMMMGLNTDRPAATALWKGRTNRVLEDGIEVAETSGLHSVMTTPLIVGDYIYGIGSHGQVRGLLAETGERVWEAEGLTNRNRWQSAFHQARGPLFRLQRERRPHHRSVQPKGLRRARPDPSAEPDLTVRLWLVPGRVPVAPPSR